MADSIENVRFILRPLCCPYRPTCCFLKCHKVVCKPGDPLLWVLGGGGTACKLCESRYV